MQAVVLAAGNGERLWPLTEHTPKPLLQFWGRPFLAYLLDNLRELVMEAVIVQGVDGRIEQHFGQAYEGLPLDYVTQPVAYGTGAALLCVQGVDEPFLVVMGDTCPPVQTIAQVIAAPGEAIVTVTPVDDSENHLPVVVGKGGAVREVGGHSRLVDAGLYRLPAAIFDALRWQPRDGGELRIRQGVEALLHRGVDVRAVEMPPPWIQIGDHEGLRSIGYATQHLRGHRLCSTASGLSQTRN